jgi:hypothetical protein
MIDPEDHVEFLCREYLRGYVDTGGSAIKFVVADDSIATDFIGQVTQAGQQASYVVASVDAVETRVNLMEQIFFQVARQIDWDDLAARALKRAVAEAGFPAPTAEVPRVDELASHYATDPRELKRDVDRELQRYILRDYDMVQEFRIGMLRLCQAAFGTGQVSDAEHIALLEWLRGDLPKLSALKSALIYRRIARHNARQMLYSLPHWLAMNGFAGLLLVIDIRRLAVARRPSPDERSGQYYTRPGMLDAYEVLRELVDSTDELARCCVVVVASPELLTDEVRGLDAYQALKFRIFDEIRDRRRDNPFSSLVRVGREEVAV